jgi:hypothetical protein
MASDCNRWTRIARQRSKSSLSVRALWQAAANALDRLDNRTGAGMADIAYRIKEGSPARTPLLSIPRASM